MRKRIKANAKIALKRQWGKAIAILLMIFATAVFFSIVEQLLSQIFSIPTFEQMLSILLSFGTVSLDMGTLILVNSLFFSLSLLSFMILTPLLQGMNRWYYHLAESNPQPVNGIFDYFVSLRYWAKSLYLSIQLIFRSFLWGILFELPAVIMYFVFRLTQTSSNSYPPLSLMSLLLSFGFAILGLIFLRIFLARYFLAKYLLSSDRKVKVRAALKESLQMMHGHWMELFFLDITFLPYYFSCIFILPILGVLPYVQTSKAIYAKIWIEKYRSEQEFIQTESIIQEESLPYEPKSNQ